MLLLLLLGLQQVVVVVVVFILAVVAFDVWAFVVVALSVEVVVWLMMVARVMAVKGIVMFPHCSI